jgi:hypothetical protein
LPCSVSLLIERRLKQLSAPAIRLARVAAVAAADFSPALAAAVLACGALDLTDAWSELEAAGVLRDRGFAHDLVYESVLAGVPRAIAGEMHGAVARVLQQGGGDAARVAEHWLGAGAADKALPLLLEAAFAAKEAMCYHEAAERFDKAIAVQASTEDRGAEFETLLACFDCLLDLDRQARIDGVLARLDALAISAAMQARALEARARAPRPPAARAALARIGGARAGDGGQGSRRHLRCAPGDDADPCQARPPRGSRGAAGRRAISPRARRARSSASTSSRRRHSW